ncbi:subclass B1 metallo-beta-lactamase [Myxococcus sp. K15C18031901]|uniref:subclass B1 metallo-beta-lactamase n=1 Tax=Myxococcus dinghuensis TaxID=2906761 RepID=UPI0020A6E724|nr:subclass B1 metallo-beta-lactamase [Myxococcus dinghuensis]MCP3098348.1 subclass B1 metallo-beta-lactamase [Myxococcus dinghuensis]
MPLRLPRSLVFCALLSLGPACTSTPDRAAPPTVDLASGSTGFPVYQLAEDVTVRGIAPGVWLHQTTADAGRFGRVSANGLFIEDGEETILVDTGWNATHGALLLTWARETLHRPVRVAVSTHFHEDRTGGIPALAAQGIPVHALELTAKLSAEHAFPVPGQTFTDSLTLGPVALFFPGAGHARDNVVVWHEKSGVLFGGCFVKDAEAKDLGNLSDADVAAWPASLDRARQRYPEARVVIPGHGEPGGPELLTHTRALLH